MKHFRILGGRWILKAACILLLVPRPSAAWNEVGHVTIAQLALQELKPATRARIVDLLDRHPARASWVPPTGADQGSLDAFLISKSATWPDAIRSQDDPHHAESRPQAHYIDLPHAPDASFPVPREMTAEALNKGLNIVNQMEWCESLLRDPGKAPEARAMALSWLIHLAGDIHQPLHCASMISPTFPQGDRGGNDVLIAWSGMTIKAGTRKVDVRLPNLHALWDDLLGVELEPQILAKTVSRCGSHKREEFKDRLTHGDFGTWARESHELAARHAYGPGTMEFVPLSVAIKDLQSGKDVHVPSVPDGYLEVARATAERQVAIAAFRLADKLEALFGR